MARMARLHGGDKAMGEMRHMRRGGGMGGGVVEHLLANASEVGLSDAQQEQLRQVRRRAPSLLMPKKQAVVEAQVDLRDLMEKNKADSAELRRANDKVLKSRSELAAAAFDLRLQVRDVLINKGGRVIAITTRDEEVLHGRRGYAAKDSGDRLLWKTYFTLDRERAADAA